MLNRLLGQEVALTEAAIAVAAVLVLAWLLAHLAARSTRVILRHIVGDTDQVSFKAPIVRTPIRIVWVVVFLLVAITLATPALELAGIRLESGLRVETLAGWLLRSGVRVALIALLAYAVVRFAGMVSGRLESQLAEGAGPGAMERLKRARTLSRLIRNVIDTAVMTVAVLMVVQELGVNIVPVLTGAGIMGLAVGFGAQTLVKDVISGFFMILEDQVRVGDVANIGGTGGLVEAINLRTIVLRDLSGTVHVIPNGSIDKISNLTKDFSFFVLDMGVAYKEDTDRVVAVMREVASDMRADETFGPNMLEPLEVLGVNDFADSAVVIKVRLKTLPLQQWSVGREYRRRLKKAFDAAGIEIPFPHRSIYVGEVTKPWPVQQVGGASGQASPRPAAVN